MGILVELLTSALRPIFGKQPLGLTELHEVTEGVFEIASKALPAIFHSLRESDPEVDQGRLWRQLFSKQLDMIANEHTWRSQAAECRRLLLKSMEDHSLLQKLLETDERTVARLLFSDALAEMSDQNVGAWLAKGLVFRKVDLTALVTLYQVKFNSALRLDEFEPTLRLMSKLATEIVLREVSHKVHLSGDQTMEVGSDTFFNEVMRPFATEFDSVKRRFVNNLLLLSPQKPDKSEFEQLAEKWRKAFELPPVVGP